MFQIAIVFDEYMKYALTQFLCKENSCRIEYELLRKDPTQTGIFYPKFYVWIKCFQKDGVVIEGAARLAAVNKQQFEVTHFLQKIKSKLIRTRSKTPFPLLSSKGFSSAPSDNSERHKARLYRC